MPCNSGGVHPFIGGLSGLTVQEALIVNKDSTPIAILFFIKVMYVTVVSRN
jgi:hypothetical protein